MKRIFPWLIFVAAVVAAGSLDAENSNPVLRVGLWGVIGVLTLWKAGDFWKRHTAGGLSTPKVENSGPDAVVDQS